MNTYYVQALSWDRLGQLLAYKTSHLGAREGDGEVNALVQGMAGDHGYHPGGGGRCIQP